MYERYMSPRLLRDVTASSISVFQARLREDRGNAEATIAAHLRQIKAALRWAERVGIMTKAPKITMPRRARGSKLMRGRPITTEEFERILAKTAVVRPDDADAWGRYLTGLWLSGLRLRESLLLSWDEDADLSVDLTGRHPRLRIAGRAQKSGNDQLLPLTPDFAEWLLETPEEDRHGPVFSMCSPRTGEPLPSRQVGRIVGRIGEKANVVVDKAKGKYATAHDLRRSFGTRWARRVMPATLQLLMRHADISTTMTFYVEIGADEIAADLWANHGSRAQPGTSLGTSGQSGVEAEAGQNDLTP
jgi:integrase